MILAANNLSMYSEKVTVESSDVTKNALILCGWHGSIHKDNFEKYSLRHAFIFVYFSCTFEIAERNRIMPNGSPDKIRTYVIYNRGAKPHWKNVL